MTAGMQRSSIDQNTAEIVDIGLEGVGDDHIAKLLEKPAKATRAIRNVVF